MTMNEGTDAAETGERIDALKAVELHRGHERANALVNHLVDQARRDGLYIPRSLTTACKNTIPPEQEVKAPGDRAIEHRLRSPSGWVAEIRTHSERLGGRPRCGNRRTIQWVAYPLALR